MSATEYYDSSGAPSTGSSGSSAVMRAEFDLIQTGFGKLPDLAGNGNKAIFVNSGGTTLAAVTAATARANLGLVIGTDVQAFDATLTAFAALTIAADSLTIGTGADAFSQVTFAANTFPAKGSTGGLVAKTISDFGLSLVDDTDALAARTTLNAVGLVGNETIAGNKTFSGSMVMNTLTVNGATGNGVITLPYGESLASVNQAGDGNLFAITAETINAVTNCFRMGAASNGMIFRARSGGAAPTATDLPASFFTVWRDTGGATTKLYYNNAGTIQSVALA